MAQAKINHDWDHTATLLALIAETHRNPETRRRPFRPEEFHPATARQARRSRPLTDAEAEAALYAFAGQKPPQQPGLWDRLQAEKAQTDGNHLQAD